MLVYLVLLASWVLPNLPCPRPSGARAAPLLPHVPLGLPSGPGLPQ